MRKLLLALVAVCAAWMPASGRTDTPLTSAALAWDRGDYVTALNTYLQLLDGPGADASFEAIALQTGELFQSVELTTDGDAPAFSPDNRHIAYETGALPARTIRLLLTERPETIAAELIGHRGVFSPDGKQFAYLKVTPTPELHRAAAAVEEGPSNQRTQRLNAFNARIAVESTLVVRDLASGRETPVATGTLRKTGLAFAGDGIIFSGGGAEADGAAQVYYVAPGAAPVALTTGPGEKTIGEVSPTGTAFTFTGRGRGGRGAGGGAGAPAAAGAGEQEQTGRASTAEGGRGATQQFGVVTLPARRSTTIAGTAPAFSPDGKSLVYVTRSGNESRLMVAELADPAKAITVRSGPERLDAPAFSPDGRQIAFQSMPKEDWEVFAVSPDGKETRRITREIQHDLLPKYLDADRMIAMIGEARHRRSYLYDLKTGARTRLFHNNSIRTIAPEYDWVPSPDGRRLLIVAERDGDTVSPERGVYLVHLDRRITRAELRQRLQANLAAEQALRAGTRRIFSPIAADVRSVVAAASVARVYGYEKALFDFDSKHITQPGNRKAAQYLFDTYKSFGYAPEFQEFQASPRGGGAPIPTANVLATLKGTVNPELVYVVSSHYDSVAVGPGADDDTSGTAALLETARLLARHPQPATIVFASFTGEEAGLLGSREYVRQAVANKVRIVGALNNDMVGWANDHRLDNTIRYSNAGIRDIQHGAAMHFTSLITYDALYYKSTDAAAYYEAYGDIVGGIGSYPVLGNPHYHQSHDLLDTINHQLVTEVAKTTAATLMLLASSPSRLAGLKVDDITRGTAKVSWTPSPEKGVTEYVVMVEAPGRPAMRPLRVKQPSATIPNVPAGATIAVKAVNARGLEGWDWARVTVR